MFFLFVCFFNIQLLPAACSIDISTCTASSTIVIVHCVNKTHFMPAHFTLVPPLSESKGVFPSSFIFKQV